MLFLTQMLCHYLKSKALQETTFRGFELVNESSQNLNNFDDKQLWLYIRYAYGCNHCSATSDCKFFRFPMDERKRLLRGKLCR